MEITINLPDAADVVWILANKNVFHSFSCKLITNMSYIKTFEFTAAVRGYHYHRQFWIPQPNQHLQCFNKPDNAFDRFAIKVCEINQENAIGHLPREISRATKFLVDRGANVNAEISSQNHRKSPLVQGGLEISCKVTASITGKCTNLLIMEKYKQLVEDLYIEPAAEEIVGLFLDLIEKDHSITITIKPKKKKPKMKEKTTSCALQRDIRTFFNEASIQKNLNKLVPLMRL